MKNYFNVNFNIILLLLSLQVEIFYISLDENVRILNRKENLGLKIFFNDERKTSSFHFKRNVISSLFFSSLQRCIKKFDQKKR